MISCIFFPKASIYDTIFQSQGVRLFIKFYVIRCGASRTLMIHSVNSRSAFRALILGGLNYCLSRSTCCFRNMFKCVDVVLFDVSFTKEICYVLVWLCMNMWLVRIKITLRRPAHNIRIISQRLLLSVAPRNGVWKK